MNEDRESFIFYGSFYESIKKLPKENQLELYNAVCAYALYKAEPVDLSDISEAIFILMKPNIDSANARYRASVENGKKGGRPKKETQQKPNKNLEETQQKPNKNLNVDVDVDDNVDDNVDVDEKLAKVISYYESNITLVIPATAPILIELSEKFDEHLIFEAINIACKKNKRNLSYIEGILKDWERKGYRTLADIQEERKIKEDDTEKRVLEALNGK